MPVEKKPQETQSTTWEGATQSRWPLAASAETGPVGGGAHAGTVQAARAGRLFLLLLPVRLLLSGLEAGPSLSGITREADRVSLP